MNCFTKCLIGLSFLILLCTHTQVGAAPFGIHVRTEPLQRVDPNAPDTVPGFDLLIPAGHLRTIPSLNRIEFTPRGAEGPSSLGSDLSLRLPSGIAANNQYLWVADTGNRRILRWDITGGSIDSASVRELASPAMRRPVGLAVQDNRLFIADAWSDQILVLDESGQLKSTIGQHGSQPGFLSGPIGLLVKGDTLVVADSRNSRIQAIDTVSGQFAYEWGLHVIRPHEGEGRLHYPTKLLLSEDGATIGVTEPWEDRVQWFRRTAEDETLEQRLPLGADDFIHYGPGIDAYKRLLAITDPDTHTVRIFDLQLDTPVLIGIIGGFGDLPSQFAHPGAVAFMPPYEGRPLRLAVLDRGNARLAIYSLDWAEQEPLRFRPKLASLTRTYTLPAVTQDAATKGQRFLVDPVAIAATDDDTLSVFDSSSNTIVVLDYRLRIQNTITVKESIKHPESTSLRRSRSGGLVLTDAADKRIFLFARDGSESTVKLPDSIQRPVDALFRKNDILVLDQSMNTIVRCDLDGNPLEYIGETGLSAGRFFKPSSLIQVTDGQIVVVDRGNHRLQFFDSEWELTSIAGPRLYTAQAKIGETAPMSRLAPAIGIPITE